MSPFATTADWNPESRSGACGRSPRRMLEIAGVVLAFVYAWPLALGYVIWKAFGYPMPKDARTFMDENLSRYWTRPARPGWGYRTTGNFAFEEYRRAELARLEEERRRLDEESRAFAGFVEELKRAKDREEFDAFMAKRRGNGAGQTSV